MSQALDLQIRCQGQIKGKVRLQFFIYCTSVSLNYVQPSTTTSNTHITLEAQMLRVVVLNINLFSFYFRNGAKWKACWPWQQCLMGVPNMNQQVSGKRFLKWIICEISFLRLYPLKITVFVFFFLLWIWLVLLYLRTANNAWHRKY